MIPKKLHYCWFGGNSFPILTLKCIHSWKQYCPDYEIIEWNENNFDITINQYVKEAYESKKWAFVSDYVRLYVVYNYGGIYMDTDVEVLKPLDVFLDHTAFSGFESESTIPTGIMGGVSGNQWFKILLSYYDFIPFISRDGSFDLRTNVITITNQTKEFYNILLNNSYQVFLDGLVIYPKEYFCPKDYSDGLINISERTYCIHHFSSSWKPEYAKIERKIWMSLGLKDKQILFRIIRFVKNKMNVCISIVR